MTTVLGDSADGNVAAVKGTHTGATGVGVEGESATGWGVRGHSISGRGVVASSETDYGLRAHSKAQAGLRSSSEDSDGMQGWSTKGRGAVGISVTGPGVAGESTAGHGVSGTTTNGAGVVGSSDTGNGGWFESNNGEGVRGWSKNAAHGGVVGVNTGGGHAGFFDGKVEVTGDLILTGADYAEELPTGPADVMPGHCVVLDDTGRVIPCAADYDDRVVGIVSGAGGLRPALVLDRSVDGSGSPIALMGTAFVQVDADRGPVRVGDLLTTSATTGHAMRATDQGRSFGALIGKALTPIDSGRGLVKVFISGR